MVAEDAPEYGTDATEVLEDYLEQDRVAKEAARQIKEQNAALATIAANTGRVAKKLDDVTTQSGGDAITTEARQAAA